MPAVCALLVPGSPLPLIRPEHPLRAGLDAAAEALARAEPDVLLVYSTRWIAVLDALWQTRPRLQGVHVDEVWHEHDLPHDIHVDRALARACVDATGTLGLRAKGVDYEGFPVDTGTVVVDTLVNRARVPLVLAANNIYHDAATTERLGALALRLAEEQGKRAAVIGVGGLSAEFFSDEVEPADDAVSRPEHDELNRRLLRLLEEGDADAVRDFLPDFSARARADHHMKHLSWLLGACGALRGATVHAYGPDFGAGAAVVEVEPTAAAAPSAGRDGQAARSPAVWRAAMRRPGRRGASRSWSGPVRP